MDHFVQVERSVLDRLLAEARANPRIECCGLLAGRDAVISVMLPARNVLGSAKAYEIAPEELFSIFRRMRSEGLQHLGIYHSHPEGENAPSPVDLERAFYPHAAYLIISPNSAAARAIRAFRIIEGRAREIPVHIVGNRTN